MKKLALSPASADLLRRWREQIARQQRRRAAEGPRPLAAIGYLVRGSIVGSVVDLRQLLVMSVMDQRDNDEQLTTLVTAFSCSLAPWGVRIGGVGQCRFQKDLNLAPSSLAKGRRFSLARPDALRLALDLDRSIDKTLRIPHLPRLRQLRWPTLWAAFQPPVAVELEGDGPELEQVAHRSGRSPEIVFRASNRVLRGREAFPLEFVSHAWRRMSSVFVDLDGLPRRQMIAIDSDAKNLCGHAGAIEFDLLNTRFPATSNSRHSR